MAVANWEHWKKFPKSTVASQYIKVFKTYYEYRITGTFGGGFNLSIEKSMAKFKIRQ